MTMRRGWWIAIIVAVSTFLSSTNIASAFPPCPMQGGCASVTMINPPLPRHFLTCATRRVPYDIVAASFNCNEQYHPADHPQNCNQDKYNEPAWVDEIHAAISVIDQAWMSMSYPPEPIFDERGAYDGFKIKAYNEPKFDREVPQFLDALAATTNDGRVHPYTEGFPCGYNGQPCEAVVRTKTRIKFNFQHDWGHQLCGVGPKSKARDVILHELVHTMGLDHAAGGQQSVTAPVCSDTLMALDLFSFTCLYFEWHWNIKPDCPFC